jgi:PAS domain S-box-containing protein
VFDSRPIEDPSEIRKGQSRDQNQSLRWVLLSIAALMAGLTITEFVLASAKDSRALIAASMGVVALWSYAMVLRHHSRWAWGPLVIGILVGGFWAMYSYGSVRASSALSMAAVVVLAGTFLKLRQVFATAIVSMGILGVLTWAEANGKLVKPLFAADVRFWSMGSATLVVVGLLLHYTRRATDEAYIRRLCQLEDRMRLEYERDQSLRRFGRIFRLNPTALLVQSADSLKVLDVNPAFERSYGYAREQIVGQVETFLWADDAQRQAHNRVLFEQGRTGWQRGLWTRADGQSVEVSMFSEMSEDRSGMLMITTVIDWTPTKLAAD